MQADSERTELLEMTQNGGFILHQTECKVRRPGVVYSVHVTLETFRMSDWMGIETRSLQHKYRCGPEVGPKGL